MPRATNHRAGRPVIATKFSMHPTTPTFLAVSGSDQAEVRKLAAPTLAAFPQGRASYCRGWRRVNDEHYLQDRSAGKAVSDASSGAYAVVTCPNMP
jgi:hypothetical protein